MLSDRVPAELQSRIDWWRRVIARQQSGPVTIAQFCRQMGITTRKFSYWRERVREADAAAAQRDARRMPSQPTAAPAHSVGASFVPVSIVSDGVTSELEIELANGCAIRLKGSLDPGLLQAAISATGQLKGLGLGEH